MTKQKHFLVYVRNWIQLAVFLATIAIGLQFYIYVGQTADLKPVTVSRPPGVEGFLPIGALMSWKRFVFTGKWDAVHPSAMVVLGFAVLLSFMLRKSFCSWFCPVGAFSEWCWRSRSRLLYGKTIRISSILDIPMRTIKYILLGFFLWAVSTMSNDQIHAFTESPYYKLSDVRMLFFFTRMTLLTAGTLSVLIILSLLFKNFWCRYLCPYGALLGLFSWISPTRIRRSEKDCVQCGLCDQACPSFLSVSLSQSVKSPECTGCMDCVIACPKKEALSLRTTGFHPHFWHPRKVGLVIVLLFITVVYAASITGHWKSSISDQEFGLSLKTIDLPENHHPSIDF